MPGLSCMTTESPSHEHTAPFHSSFLMSVPNNCHWMLRWPQQLLLSGKRPKKDKTTYTIGFLTGAHRPNWAFVKRMNFGACKVFLEGDISIAAKDP